MPMSMYVRTKHYKFILVVPFIPEKIVVCLPTVDVGSSLGSAAAGSGLVPLVA
jgi:hypothetical protein